ncbi:hypothetical protein CO2235_MP60036 [Cupriavidus oxalaticus]|uniref:Uncharacterized protein n=1 Tax=Cupriavidus oxalaticus TaxID=96344 RepID=A0A976BIH8_9BURK|nr:hypothetical protein CO2235_MP60036 [Cupriavidus oxalaticus]
MVGEVDASDRIISNLLVALPPPVS